MVQRHRQTRWFRWRRLHAHNNLLRSRRLTRTRHGYEFGYLISGHQYRQALSTVLLQIHGIELRFGGRALEISAWIGGVVGSGQRDDPDAVFIIVIFNRACMMHGPGRLHPRHLQPQHMHVRSVFKLSIIFYSYLISTISLPSRIFPFCSKSTAVHPKYHELLPLCYLV